MGSWWREAQEKNLANEFAESAVRTPLVMTHVKEIPLGLCRVPWVSESWCVDMSA
jgi:hypothetical protein